jgi:hypothetical protein
MNLISKIISFIIVILIFLYVARQYTKRKCSSVSMPVITGIGKKDANFDYMLRDFYIKSSYNSCATGNFKNDWVDLCALGNVIKQGCRCLDFEIYSVNEKAVVAVSNSTKMTEKGTYNSIPLEDVIKYISENAISQSMSTSSCPNSNDPLLLHFRMKSDHLEIYDALAKCIVEYLDGWLLPSEFSYENHGNNLGNTSIKQLLGKVILMIDKVDGSKIKQSKLDELVNILGNSAFLRSLYYNDVVHTPDMDELIDFNKKNMTICYPNLSYKSDNYNSSITMQYGVQMSAMCFQTNDTFLQAYNTLFNSSGYAFILKPEKFRYTPVVVEDAPPIDPNLSYGYKTYQSNYYKFNL